MFHVAILRGKPGNLWSAIKASIKDIQIKMTRTNRIYETFFFCKSLASLLVRVQQARYSAGFDQYWLYW